MSGSEIRRLLVDEDGERGDGPELTLLPWLARHASPTDLPAIARAAASVSTLAPRAGGWPVIADAVAAILAARVSEPGELLRLLDILPPLAGHLSRTKSAAVDWLLAKPDSRCYGWLSRYAPGELSRNTASEIVASTREPELWLPVLRVSPSADVLPPLADLRSLAWLAVSGVPGRVAETDDAAAYLLPLRYPRDTERGQATQRRQVVEAVNSAVRDGRAWYAAAVVARAIPFLDAAGRAELRAATAELPAAWRGHLARLVENPGAEWASDEAELAASHPAITRLTELVATTAPGESAAICRDVTARLVVRYGLDGGWVPDGGDWDFSVETEGDRSVMRDVDPGRSFRWPDVGSFLAGDYPHVTIDPEAILDVDFGDQGLLGIEEPEPARSVNIYVAEIDSNEPVNEPLELDRGYDVCCNVGPADNRSMIGGEAAAFPEEHLPDGPLLLHAFLMVDGRKAASTAIELPVAGPSGWVRLRLPSPSEPGVLDAELAIYYGTAPVVIYALSIPFGSPASGRPVARLQHRISRSLTDLEKVSGRSLSFLVSSIVPAVYVNGLDYAPEEFSHVAQAVSDAAYEVREALYHAHFSVRGQGRNAGEVSRYTVSRNRSYEKSLADLDGDMRQLARCGAAIYEEIFQADDALPRRIRDEATAYGRPPILQVVTPGRGMLSIPWAAIYDLPLSDDPDEYETCRSIADFGPGGNGGDPPLRCPYECEHQDLNQLCPWGFWGLSAIIEYPPSAESRDLEVRTRAGADAAAILMGYDTSLDAALASSHIAALRTRHSAAFVEPQLTSRADVQRAITEGQTDVLYFYSHINDDRTRPGKHLPAIGLGADQVTAKDIGGWGRAAWSGQSAPSTQSHRHPLVILSGCHSVEVGPESLHNLVTPFVKWVRASGLIGTEVTIEQGLGGWAMELFLAELRRSPVGIALRSTRWQMFGKGNIMGLGYTPYCLAGLTLAL